MLAKLTRISFERVRGTATYSICLLMRNLWEDEQLHHQFQLVERESRMVLEDSIEIHTVELSKYNRDRRGQET